MISKQRLYLTDAKAVFLACMMINVSIQAEQENVSEPKLKKTPVYAFAATTATAIGTSCLIASGIGTFTLKHAQEIIEYCNRNNIVVNGETVINNAQWCSRLIVPGILLTVGSIAYLIKSYKGARAKIRSLLGSFNSVYGSLRIFIAAVAAGAAIYANNNNIYIPIHPDDVGLALTVFTVIGLEGLLLTTNGYCLQPAHITDESSIE